MRYWVQKDKKKILIANFIVHIWQTIAMVLLNGYTGAAMAVIMILRDITLIIQEIKKAKGKIYQWETWFNDFNYYSFTYCIINNVHL